MMKSVEYALRGLFLIGAGVFSVFVSVWWSDLILYPFNRVAQALGVIQLIIGGYRLRMADEQANLEKKYPG